MLGRAASALALLTALVLAWLLLEGLPATPAGWAWAGGSVGVITLFAVAADLPGRGGSGFSRIGHVALLWGTRVLGAIGGWGEIARRAFQVDIRLAPALIKYRTRDRDLRARAGLAAAVGRTPGLATVETAEDHILVHVLIEHPTSDNGIAALDRACARAFDRAAPDGAAGGGAS
jgi:multisubunit Na+/H+ antiporter MnhE subunit